MEPNKADILTREELNNIFYSGIRTKKHFRTRCWSYFLSFLFNAKFLFKSSKLPVLGKKPVILFFSTDAFIDSKQFDDYELLIFKEKVQTGTKICFRKEDALMSLAFLMPFAIKKYLYQLAYAGIERKLRSFDIRFFICNNPELLNYPIARYLKTKEISSGTIQHGVYMPDHYSPNFYETTVADYVFVWGDVYRQTFHAGGVPLKNLHLFCPPFYFELQSKVGQPVKPVFLGQQYYKGYDSIIKPYNEVVEKLAGHYSKKGIKLHYKPHPREDITKSLTSKARELVEICPVNSVNTEFFTSYTHAFSINSTSLIKALCSGLASYQTNHEAFEVDNIDYYKYARIPMIYLHNMEDELSKPVLEVTEDDIDRNFLYLKPNPTFENAQILRQCINNTYPS